MDYALHRFIYMNLYASLYMSLFPSYVGDERTLQLLEEPFYWNIVLAKVPSISIPDEVHSYSTILELDLPLDKYPAEVILIFRKILRAY